MATISTPGVGSGLDIQSIVARLVQLEQRPIAQLQSKTSGLQARVSAFGQLKSQFANFQDQLAKLTAPSAWTSMRVTSTDPGAVTGTATSSALPTNFSVGVTALARAQSAGSVGIAQGSAVGEGVLQIDLGRWNGNVFEPGSSAAVSVSVSATDTLRDVAAKISNANAGVSAVVIRDGTDERLLIRSNATGEQNAFRIRAFQADATTPIAPNTGLARLAFDFDTGSSQFVGLQRGADQTALDAQITINGVNVASPNNTFTDVVDGLALTVSKVTTAPASLTVAKDTAAVSSAIDSFVASYNAIASALAEMTRFNPADNSAGTLQGDPTAIGLQTALRRLATTPGPAGLPFSTLSDIGVEFQADGTLKVNSTKVNAALENRESLERFFRDAGTTPQTQGIAKRLEDFTKGLLATDGAISTRSQSLQAAIQRNSREQERLQERVSRTEERLLAQYSRLDSNLASLNALSSYVAQQLTAINNFNNQKS